jgi:hypothetical protein
VAIIKASRAAKASARWDAFHAHPEDVADREHLLVEIGNEYPRQPGDYGIFTTIPVWWRGFFFHVLSPPQVAAYVYLCMETRPDGLAHPVERHFRVDMNRKSKSSIYDYVGVLVRKGFFLKNTHFPGASEGSLKPTRNVYQRPLPQHTILTLLERGEITERLFPSKCQPQLYRDLRKRHGKVIDDSLRRMLGDQTFEKYERASSIERRKKVLADGLQLSLERHAQALREERERRERDEQDSPGFRRRGY